MFCPQCGCELKTNWRFCGMCGERICDIKINQVDKDMLVNNEAVKVVGNVREIKFQSRGGRACLEKHGRDYYKIIAKKYWDSPAGIYRKNE